MLARCKYDNRDNFRFYGGRGISVCERWRASFEAFLADMGPMPSPRHTLERIDVNGNYEPGNVRWATWHEQMRNRRNSRMVTFNGETLCVSEWAERMSLKPHTLMARLNSGWTVQRALTTQTKKRAA